MGDLLEMWTIYDSPLDAPQRFVVRRWTIVAGEAVPDDEAIVVRTLARARAAVPEGLTCVPRQGNDEPQVVETWI